MHRILVVDDEEGLLVPLRSILEGPSRQLVVARTGAGALLALAGSERPVDVALIDLYLPDGSGIDVLRYLRRVSPQAEALLMTGYTSAASAVEACRLGVADYLEKPFDLARAAQAIDRACQRIDQRRAEARRHAELVLSEERHLLAASAALEGVWSWDLGSNLCFFSPGWWQVMGCSAPLDANRPDHWFARVHPADRDRLERALADHLEGRTPRFECEYRAPHGDGSEHWLLNRGLAVHGADGKTLRIAGALTDVTERHGFEARLSHDAFHDPLTGLANQALFRERLAQALRLGRRRGSVSAVLFLDLDRFKNINDGLGHLVGDRLLVELARRLELCVRASDTFARLGGDEFAVLLEGVENISEAVYVAERVLLELKRPFKLDGHEVFAGTSIGITLSSGQEEPEAVLREADTAMYRAKAQGRGRYEVFDTAMHEAATRLLQLETDLRRALDRREFTLHYQPIVQLTTGRISGFEALLRWSTPQRGEVSPAEFIPVAEEMGLITPLGNWVLREACAQMRVWQTTIPACRGLFMTVNLSSRQLMNRDLVSDVRQILAQTELDPRSLKLEITESTLISDLAAAKATLEQLKAMNIRLCLDDFGTGYSSLSFLHQLPIDTLKIDRSFVSRLEAAGDGAEIVKTIVMLARALDLDVIAEGVETAAQVMLLRKLRCRYGQGFHYSRGIEAPLAGRLFPEPWRAGGHAPPVAIEPEPSIGLSLVRGEA